MYRNDFVFLLFLVSFCISLNSLDAADVRGKMQMLTRCLSTPPTNSLTEEWGIDESDTVGINNTKRVIDQFLQREGIASYEKITYAQFPRLLDALAEFPQNVRDFLSANWADLHGFDSDEANVYADRLLGDLLNAKHLTTLQYIDVLHRYTMLHAFTLPAIDALKTAQKRTDLTRDQMFYIDTRLAHFDTKDRGLEHFDFLVKKYPDKRQCVGICGEQIALHYRFSDRARSLECYKRVIQLCPEMLDEAASLLGFTAACRDEKKPELVLDHVLRYVDVHPEHIDTLEVLSALAYIYHDDLEEYDKAAQTWRKITDFVVPASLQTQEIQDTKQRAKTNYEIALRLAASGGKKSESYELTVAFFWTPARVVTIVTGVIFIGIALMLIFFDKRKRSGK